MSSNTKTILLRFARGLGAIVAASVAAFVIGPEFLAIIPDEYDNYVVIFLAPLILAVEKFLRDGGDATA